MPRSTSAQPRSYHPEVNFDGRRSYALVEQARVVDLDYFGQIIGYLSRADMLAVESALARYLGIVAARR